MRKKRSLIMLALVVGVLVLSVSGVAGARKHNKVDSAKGKGEFVTEPIFGMILTQKFDFDAKDLDEDPLTDTAKGKFEFEQNAGSFFSQSGKFKGEVVCLRVEDGRAVFVSRIEEGSGVFEGTEGKFVGAHVLDAGQPKGNGDGIATFGLLSSGTCPAPSDLYQPLTHGNITVRDVV